MQAVTACLRALLSAGVFALVACSGGGGGGDDTGGSSPGTSATLNSGNIDEFVSDTELAMLIGATAETAFVSVQQTSPTTLSATQYGICGGGSASYSLNTDANGNITGTGAYANYSRCFNLTLNGNTTVTGKISNGALNYFDLSFTDLVYTRGGGQSFRLSGTIHLAPKPSVNGSAGYMMTLNATLYDATNSVMSSLKNFEMDADLAAGVEYISIKGRVTDPAFGFVDVFSPVRLYLPLPLPLPGEGPSSGTIVMKVGGIQALITYVNSAYTADIGPIPTDNNPPDNSFGTYGTVITPLSGHARALVLQPDGKLVAAGGGFALVRLNADGSPDTSFDGDGIVTTNFDGAMDQANALVLQPDGKLVAAGGANMNTGNGDFALARYNPDGSLDAGFGLGGKVKTDLGSDSTEIRALVMQPDGKLVAAGTFYLINSGYNFALTRYNHDGSPDIGFGSNGVSMLLIGTQYANLSALLLQPDGKFVAAGTSLVSSQFGFLLVRYDANGSLDTGFGSGGKVTIPRDDSGGARGIIMQPDGKLVVSGFLSGGTGSAVTLARYNTDGSLDAGFGVNGVASHKVNAGSAGVGKLVMQPDGKFVVIGTTMNGVYTNLTLVRFTNNGTLDSGFGMAGVILTSIGSGDTSGNDLVLQPDGKIVAAGSAVDGVTMFALARYLP